LLHGHGRPSKSIKPLTTKTWYIGRVCNMHQNFDHIWVKCREPINPNDPLFSLLGLGKEGVSTPNGLKST
jgi:hypothetical protein